MKPGIYDNLSNEDYHAGPGISKSGISKMLISPAHYKAWKKDKQEPTPAMIFGSAFHTIILEPDLFKSEYVVAPKCDRRTKKGKEIYAEFQKSAEGKTVLTQGEWDTFMCMHDAVEKHYANSLLQMDGPVEQSVFWDAGGILCKCRPDKTIPKLDLLIDLKTCRSASPKDFARDCANFGYDIQAAWYTWGTGHKDFTFIAVEKTPPYAVAVYNASKSMMDKGHEKIDSALSQYRECIESGVWDAYPEPMNLFLPSWA